MAIAPRTFWEGLPLFDEPPKPAVQFLGETFDEQRDGERLGKQLEAVRRFMEDGHWATLGEISAATNHPEASVSARLRDCRRMGYVVERRFVHKGLHQYRMVKL